MMLSLYVALGIFLLIAVRNPSAHRSLIAFAAWSSFAHAVSMSILGLEIASQRVGFLVASAVLVGIGVALIVLAPAKRSVQPVSVWPMLRRSGRPVKASVVQRGKALPMCAANAQQARPDPTSLGLFTL